MDWLPFALPSLNFSPLRYRPHGVGNWSGHIPFACDLVAALRPTVFVELGTHLGESYFAFCQAIAASGIDAKAFAVDTWRGDAHTGAYGDEVFREVEKHNREHFGTFSQLMRMSFDEAASEFGVESIDLLHIDGLHTYEAVRHDFDAWWPKVRHGGIVLFHDSAVRDGDFGVWKLLEELRECGLSIAEFFHSHGLGVVMKPGTPVESGMLSLLFGGDTAAVEGMRRYYEICADHLEQQFWSARRKRTAEWDVTTQLFWRSEGERFSEKASIRAAHTVTAGRSRVLLGIPPLSAPPVELRIDLTDRPAFLELHGIAVFTAGGEMLWSMQPADRLKELRSRGLYCVPAADGSGVLAWDAPLHVTILLPIAPSVIASVQSGGQAVVEMSGLDAWSFASQAAGLIS